MKLILLILLTPLWMVGCYEGRHRSANPSGGGSGGGDENHHLYYWIVFEPIFLSEKALADSRCFKGPSSERVYRRLEWESRMKLISQGLKTLGEHFVEHPLRIEPEDCETMKTLHDRATEHWLGSNQWPEEADSKKRLSIHLKAIFWDRDTYRTYPSAQVQTIDWPDVLSRRRIGINTISLHYRLNSNASYGYFGTWFWQLPSASTLTQTGISNPDPTEAGSLSRTQQIKLETEEFFKWFQGAANDYAPRSRDALTGDNE